MWNSSALRARKRPSLPRPLLPEALYPLLPLRGRLFVSALADKVICSWGATVILAVGATVIHFFLQGGWCGYNGGPTDEQRQYSETIRGGIEGIIVASIPGALLVVGAVAATLARSGRVAAVRWVVALVIAWIVFFTIPFVVVGGSGAPFP